MVDQLPPRNGDRDDARLWMTLVALQIWEG